MSDSKKILVLGGTGPTGICLLRELLHRKYPVIAFARNPKKLPEELSSNPLLEVVKGELTDKEAISDIVSRSSAILSLLGPNLESRSFDPDVFPDFYELLFPLMREHGVSRIFAMSTFSYFHPRDKFSLLRWIAVIAVWAVVHTAWQTVRRIVRVFDEGAGDLDWTVYRIGMVTGGHDEASWKRDREAGEVFEGWVAQKGWTIDINRSSLAKWLADGADGGKTQWVRSMPAVAQLAGSPKLA